MQIAENAIEVTVISGGLAGMAASIHLSKAGLRVLCIEPDVTDARFRRRVAGLVHAWSVACFGRDHSRTTA
jgi:thioredoxin reductase